MQMLIKCTPKTPGGIWVAGGKYAYRPVQGFNAGDYSGGPK